MSCSAPATEECLGYIHLGPSGVADWANKAGRIVEASHRLILYRTESPHISTPTEVMRGGGVEEFAHRVRRVRGWKSIVVGVSAGIPFRRRSHESGGPWPVAIFPSVSLGID